MYSFNPDGVSGLIRLNISFLDKVYHGYQWNTIGEKSISDFKQTDFLWADTAYFGTHVFRQNVSLNKLILFEPKLFIDSTVFVIVDHYCLIKLNF